MHMGSASFLGRWVHTWTQLRHGLLPDLVVAPLLIGVLWLYIGVDLH